MHPYDKLRSPPDTALDEICACEPIRTVKLMEALGFNPVHCLYCNLEVGPERLNLPEELAERLADWDELHRAIRILWLDSSDYEKWARRELLNVDSSVNTRGYELARQLNNIVPCYFVLFDDQSDPEYVPRSECPQCGRSLIEIAAVGSWRVCHHCRIVSPG